MDEIKTKAKKALRVTGEVALELAPFILVVGGGLAIMAFSIKKEQERYADWLVAVEDVAQRNEMAFGTEGKWWYITPKPEEGTDELPTFETEEEK